MVMKKKLLKFLVILSFLLIIIPTPHVILPIFIILFLGFLQMFYEDFHMDNVYTFMMLMGVILLFLKKIYIKLIGHSLLLIALFSIIHKEDFENLLFVSSFILHLILSGVYYYKIFSERKTRCDC